MGSYTSGIKHVVDLLSLWRSIFDVHDLSLGVVFQ